MSPFWLGLSIGMLIGAALVVLGFLALAAWAFATSDGSWFHAGVKI